MVYIPTGNVSCPLWILVAKPKTTLFLNVNALIPSVKNDFATRITLGTYCLLAQHKEHTIKRNFLLDMST
jgi:hypothetical protein